jgi:carbon storage regulator
LFSPGFSAHLRLRGVLFQRRPGRYYSGMLILGRKVGDSIIIGDNIKVVVLANDRGGVRIGIEAPSDVTILRGEIVSDVTAENQRAGAADAAATQEWLKVLGGPKPDAPSASASVARQRPAAE